MLNNLVFAATGTQRFTVSAEESHKIRAAVFEKKPVLAMIDIARLFGLKAPGKAAERFPCEKVKLETRIERGCGASTVWMVYCSVEDAIKFAENHRIPGNVASIQFLESIADELKNNSIDTLLQPPVQQNPKTFCLQPFGTDNVTLSARIDRMIAELLMLRQEIS